MAYLLVEKVMTTGDKETRFETLKEAKEKLSETLEEYYEVGFVACGANIVRVSDVTYKFYNRILGCIGSVYIKKVQ